MYKEADYKVPNENSAEVSKQLNTDDPVYRQR